MYIIEDFTFPEIIRKSTSHYGDRLALSVLGGPQFSYRDVDRTSARIAAGLQSAGIRKGDRVAILAESSPYWGMACLATGRIGAIAVPILTDFTTEQIKNILAHSGAKLLFCSERQLAKVGDTGLGLTVFDIRTGMPYGREGPAGNETFTPVDVDGDDTLLIVYTSGTTGLSKGVVLSHRNIISNAVACRSIIRLNRLDRLLSILPMAHTYEFTLGFIIPYTSGSRIFYLDRPPSVTVLLPALKTVRPTIMLSVPLVIEKMYRSSILPRLQKMKLYGNRLFRPILIRVAGMKMKRLFGGKLRFFGIGGAPLSADVEEFLHEAGFPYAIGYGLTETSPLLAGSPPAKTCLRSTGPALKGVTLRIADPRPGSGEGEIQAKGPNVFKGYYRDEDRTKEAFTDDGWFRTGDLGFRDKKGRIHVRGRIKTMILGASGENIYPEEIEAVLNQSPYVAESLVFEDAENGLTALVYLKSEMLENIEARIQDGIEGITALVGTALGNGEKQPSQAGKASPSAIGNALSEAEQKIAGLLASIKKEANEKLASFSKIRSIKRHQEPFEKTPTQKIKRFLYGKTRPQKP